MSSGLRRGLLLTATVVGGVLAPIAAILITLHTRSAHPGVPTYEYVDDGMLTQVVLVPLTLVMVWRRSDHAITYLYVWLSFCAGMQQLTGAYAVEGLLGDPLSGAVAAMFGQTVFQTWVVLSFLLLLALFPTGTTVGRWFGWLPSAMGLLLIVTPALLLVSPQPFLDPEVPQPAVIEGIVGPWSAAPAPVVTVLGLVNSVLMALAVVGVIVQIVIRFRRSRGVERQQLRWFVSSVVMSIILFLVVGGVPLIADSVVGRLLNVWAIAPALVVGSMALAVLRYRLYDIDRIISRTVSYVLVVGLLGVVFAAGVVWIPGVFEFGESPLVVAGTTLAVAALFNPLRKRVQSAVDRRFNRTKYDAERVMEVFTGSLRSGVDEPSLLSGWVGVVSDTMHPSSIGVWVR